MPFTERNRNNDPKREPGLIDLARYKYTMPGQGFVTYRGAPVALTKEDLKAGGVEAAIIGVPIDVGITQGGTALAPLHIRIEGGWTGNFKVRDDAGKPAFHSHQHARGFELWKTIVIADYGDCSFDPYGPPEVSFPEIEKRIKEIVESNAVPICLGGDHVVPYPVTRALADIYGKGKIGVVHFDAHYDGLESSFGHLYSHATWIRRLIEEGIVDGKNFIQVGIRSPFPDETDWQWMEQHQMRVHTMAEIERHGFNKVLDKAIEQALDGAEHLYISIDMDSIDAAYAPACASPEPGGLTSAEAMNAIRRLVAEVGIVGFDVVELIPTLEGGRRTAQLANCIVYEALIGLAMRKLGLTETNYIHPHSTGDHHWTE